MSYFKKCIFPKRKAIFLKFDLASKETHSHAFGSESEDHLNDVFCESENVFFAFSIQHVIDICYGKIVNESSFVEVVLDVFSEYPRKVVCHKFVDCVCRPFSSFPSKRKPGFPVPRPSNGLLSNCPTVADCGRSYLVYKN